jgi:hypothetical protein
MALTTYEEVRPWARAIKLRTAKREMPPWFLEKNVGIQQFKDDISLSDAEIATIGAWVDGGALLGNLADMPPARQFADINAWSIGEPDLIVDSPLMTVKAVGGDYHAPYVGATPTGLTEDRWIAAFEVKEYRPGETQRTPGRPGGGNNYFVLHHQGRPDGNSPWTPGWMPPPVPADGKFPVKVTFSEPGTYTGTYTVRVLAHDGGLDTAKDVIVTVN